MRAKWGRGGRGRTTLIWDWLQWKAQWNTALLEKKKWGSDDFVRGQILRLCSVSQRLVLNSAQRFGSFDKWPCYHTDFSHKVGFLFVPCALSSHQVFSSLLSLGRLRIGFCRYIRSQGKEDIFGMINHILLLKLLTKTLI